MNKATSLLVIIPLALSLASPSFARSKPLPPKALKDVPANHWARGYVEELYESGVMVGDPTGAFRGASAITRYEMAVALATLISNNNRELLEDREDLASLVGIMEQFQNELTILDAKLTKISNDIGSITGTVGEVQEQSEEVATKIEATGDELAAIRTDVNALKNRGLVFGTVLKGAANDIRSVGKGAAYVAKKATKRGVKEDDATKEVDAEVIEQVVVPKPAAKPVVEEVLEPVEEEVEEEVKQPVIEEPKPVPVKVEAARPVKKAEEPKPKLEEAKPVIQDTARSYVPKMQAPVIQSYEAPKPQAPSPKTIVQEEHNHYDSQELDGELIQEIHQTLQEMH